MVFRYARGHAEKIATRFRPGACENCGAMTHKRKDCVERPRRTGARFTGTDFAPDEYVQSDIQLSWDGKRDRWNGVDITWHQHKIQDEHNRLAEAKKMLKAKKLDEDAIEDEKAAAAAAAEQETAEPQITVPVKPTGSDEKTKSSGNKVDSDDDDEDEEYKYTDSMDMPGQHVDSKQRISVRNLRIREDTAKYLLNLDANSAYYDPKSRSMRDNPFEGTNKDPSQVPYLGDNFVRYSGDAKQFARSQIFAWEAAEKGVNIHTQADPTKLELLNIEFHEKKNQFVKTVQEQLIERYGGEEHLNSIPRELVVEAQTEQYVEYNRFGKVIKGDQRATVKSKYVEDTYENEHTTVWGSYWNNYRWGYACCHLLLRQSYCPGMIIDEKDIRFESNNVDTTVSGDKPESLVQLHRKKLNKEKFQPKNSSSVDESNPTLKKLDKKKVQEAARDLAERERQAESVLNIDERKRKYNALKTDVNDQHEPTEEELEAYRLKKHRHDDPMARYVLNS
jgi:pre-mRNA-processing factor SLU7